MIIFDIETNGLLDDLDKVHCLVLKDTSTDKVETYLIIFKMVLKD